MIYSFFQRHWLILLICIFSCSPPSQQGQKIDSLVYNKLIDSCSVATNKEIFLYYFDGDCPLCLGEAKEMEETIKNRDDITTLFIVTTANPELFENNINRLHLQSCIIIDNELNFTKTFKFNSKIRIDSAMNITEL